MVHKHESPKHISIEEKSQSVHSNAHNEKAGGTKLIKPTPERPKQSEQLKPIVDKAKVTMVTKPTNALAPEPPRPKAITKPIHTASKPEPHTQKLVVEKTKTVEQLSQMEKFEEVDLTKGNCVVSKASDLPKLQSMPKHMPTGSKPETKSAKTEINLKDGVETKPSRPSTSMPKLSLPPNPKIIPKQLSLPKKPEPPLLTIVEKSCKPKAANLVVFSKASNPPTLEAKSKHIPTGPQPELKAAKLVADKIETKLKEGEEGESSKPFTLLPKQSEPSNSQTFPKLLSTPQKPESLMETLVENKTESKKPSEPKNCEESSILAQVVFNVECELGLP